jgi:hypothetical protein
MYIEAVPNRNSPPAILLRESYRHQGKVRKRTLCNLSDWSPAHVEGLRGVLKGGTVIPAEQDAFTVTRSLPHGHVAACSSIGIERYFFSFGSNQSSTSIPWNRPVVPDSRGGPTCCSLTGTQA